MILKSTNKGNEYFIQAYKLASLGAEIKISDKKIAYNEKEIEELVKTVKDNQGKLTISFNGKCTWMSNFLLHIAEIGGDSLTIDLVEYNF